MKKVIARIVILCLINILLIFTIIGCAAKGHQSTWNNVYAFDIGLQFWSFNDDGTSETIQFGTYSFDEIDDKTVVCLDFDEMEGQGEYVQTYFISPAKEDGVDLILDTSKLGLANEVELDASVIKLKFKSGPDSRPGLTELGNLFNGTYSRVIEEKEYPAYFEFYDSGVFAVRAITNYEVIDEEHVRNGEVTYLYEKNDDDGKLCMWTEDGYVKFDLHKVTSDDIIRYVLPNNKSCSFETGHDYVVTMVASFSDANASIGNMKPNTLYTIMFCTDNPEISFKELETLLSGQGDDTELAIHDVRFVGGDGSFEMSYIGPMNIGAD